VFILAQIPSPEAADILLDLAADSREADVRKEAVQWLSEVHDDRAITVLQGILLAPAAPRSNTAASLELRETALFSLTQLATTEDAPVFRRLATSRYVPSPLRVRAVQWLADQRIQQHTDWIIALYRADRNPTIRQAVVSSVAAQRDMSERRWLMDVGRDTTATIAVRKIAISAAADLSVPTADLYALYHEVEPVSLREHIIELLGRNREKNAIDRLIDIARLDADSTMRTSSLKVLRQSKDPKAVEFVIAYRER
jgi:HEAT repeat protein